MITASVRHEPRQNIYLSQCCRIRSFMKVQSHQCSYGNGFDGSWVGQSAMVAGLDAPICGGQRLAPSREHNIRAACGTGACEANRNARASGRIMECVQSEYESRRHSLSEFQGWNAKQANFPEQPATVGSFENAGVQASRGPGGQIGCTHSSMPSGLGESVATRLIIPTGLEWLRRRNNQHYPGGQEANHKKSRPQKQWSIPR